MYYLTNTKSYTKNNAPDDYFLNKRAFEISIPCLENNALQKIKEIVDHVLIKQSPTFSQLCSIGIGSEMGTILNLKSKS